MYTGYYSEKVDEQYGSSRWLKADGAIVSCTEVVRTGEFPAHQPDDLICHGDVVECCNVNHKVVASRIWLDYEYES